MLTARPINSDATLNNFALIDDQDFAPGENRTLAWQLFNDERNLRYVLPSTAVVTLTFNSVGATTFAVTASFIDAGDRSLIGASLTPAQTLNLVSGNIAFKVDVLGDGSILMMGVIRNALRRLDTTAG